MKTRSFAASLGFLIFVLPPFGRAAVAANPATAKAELVRTEAAFFEYARAHGFTAAVRSYIAPDGFIANSLTLGREAPAEREKTEPAKPPRNPLRWQPLHAEVSASGDLGYTWGVAGSAATEENAFKPYGIYVMIWKRQADGTWKFSYDAATILSAERIEAFVREHFPAAAAAAKP